MKNFNFLTIKILFVSVLSIAMSIIAGPVSAQPAGIMLSSPTPVFLASNSFSAKPPYHRHIEKQSVVQRQQINKSISKYFTSKPPFTRHLSKKDKLHTVQIAQLGDMSGVIIENTDERQKKLSGKKPPFKRNW